MKNSSVSFLPYFNASNIYNLSKVNKIFSTLFTLVIVVVFNLHVRAQVGGAFFAVHCDPPNSANWSSLVEIVDSANAYNVPLTIMLTPPWADSVYSDPAKASKLVQWQIQGHEIGAHHHGITAPNPLSWDGFTNSTNLEIAQAGLDSLDKRGNMNDYLSFMIPIAGAAPLTTGGIAEENEWPAGLIFRAEGLNYNHTDVFSSISVYTHNGQQVCGLTYANVGQTSVGYATGQFNNFGVNDYAGLITHATNFTNDASKRNAALQWFNFISDSSQTSTIRDIMNNAACTVTPIQKVIDVIPSQEFYIYPNPSTNNISVHVIPGQAGPVDIRLFTLSGQLINHFRFSGVAFSNILELDVARIARGVYILQLISEDKVFVKKLILN